MTERTITLTAAEWGSVQPDGSLWLAWEGDDGCCDGASPICPPCQAEPTPPAVFVRACAPCGCKGTNLTIWDGMNPQHPCPDCRIELVGPCPTCESRAVALHNAYEVAAERHGWATQERSRKPWGEVPEANRATMIDALRVTLGCDSPVPCDYGTVTPGHAYAIGQPLPISDVWPDQPPADGLLFVPTGRAAYHKASRPTFWLPGQSKGTEFSLAALAHYGPPETLVGRWAIQLRVVQ